LAGGEAAARIHCVQGVGHQPVVGGINRGLQPGPELLEFAFVQPALEEAELDAHAVVLAVFADIAPAFGVGDVRGKGEIPRSPANSPRTGIRQTGLV